MVLENPGLEAEREMDAALRALKAGDQAGAERSFFRAAGVFSRMCDTAREAKCLRLAAEVQMMSGRSEQALGARFDNQREKDTALAIYEGGES